MKTDAIAGKILCFAFLFAMRVTQAADAAATNPPPAIPWDQIGAKAGADYQGDGLAVTPSERGARLHCVFQRLDGEATTEGLWLTSIVSNAAADAFRVRAMEVGRAGSRAGGWLLPGGWGEGQLPPEGRISIEGQTVRCSRPGLTEEYSVSMDGVRQDFIVEQAPLSSSGGELIVTLAVTGATVEPADYGATLVLQNSARRIAYSRVRVTDATGKELPARMEVSLGQEEEDQLSAEDTGLFATRPASKKLAVVVKDAEAVYPLRIDPTFSDANWISLGVAPGTDFTVSALVVSGGTLYVGGSFTTAGGTAATNIAQWDGSNWSPLGSGMNIYGGVFALAVSGGTLYAGGGFTNAGGSAAKYIAQWNGSNWSPLGSGMNNYVGALAVSGGTLYAGGGFTMAGTNASGYVAEGILAPMIGSFNPSTGQLNMANLIPGQSCVVQTSTDLVNWVCVQTNTVCTASQTVQLPVIPQASTAFYRLMELP